jgi:DNA-binding HxlR family transcriptional regulator
VSKLLTRASSINRGLDQIGDKWCLLIIQEVFWGINSFTDLMTAMGVSRGVLSNRLKWLQSVDCLKQAPEHDGGKRMRYHLTPKSIDMYPMALMAIAWERKFFRAPDLDQVELTHHTCHTVFTPEMRCGHCDELVAAENVSYLPGPGATQDERDKKVRRRSSIAISEIPSERSFYRNLINIVGDRWTANIIALSFHGYNRFDQFLQELPVATNILTARLKFLVEEKIFSRTIYQQKPTRYEYKLTEKGAALFPYFLALLQWGDTWCNPSGDGKPMHLTHTLCGHSLQGQVRCSACAGLLKAHQVNFDSIEWPPTPA